MTRLAPPLDVLDHRFGAGDPLTVGVEEEYMLLDPDTLDLVQRVESILRAEEHGAFAELVSPELFESLVEFHTPVCRTAADAGRQLHRVREHAIDAAAAQGLRLGSAGTHPFSLFERQHVTERERYRALLDELQYAARRELIFGLHVHVAVDDPDRAIRIMAGLQPHLCELVALSANSPLWRGEPTGFSSCRHLIFSAFPRSGPSPSFADYAEYARVVGELVACGAIEDYTRTWWDVRPHPRFGTVEVRVMDAATRLDDAVALTAYVQALVARLDAADRRGGSAAAQHPVVAQENKWQAARHGLEARVADPEGGAPVAIRDLIGRTLGRIGPFAREREGDRALAGVTRILREGNGADRQLAVLAATGDAVAVTRDIVAATSPRA